MSEHGDDNLITFENGRRINMVEALLMYMKQREKDHAVFQNTFQELVKEMTAIKNTLNNRLKSIDDNMAIAKEYAKHRYEREVDNEKERKKQKTK